MPIAKNFCARETCSNLCVRSVCKDCAKRIRSGELPPQHGVNPNPPCIVDECPEPRRTANNPYCIGHYNAQRKGKKPEEKRAKRKNGQGSIPILCSKRGCSTPAQYKGFCTKHSEKSKTKPCKFSKCDIRVRRTYDREYCRDHQKQLDTFGIVWTGTRPTEAIRYARSQKLPECEVSYCTRKRASKNASMCQTCRASMNRKGCTRGFFLEMTSKTECEACGDTTKLFFDHDHSCHTGDKMCESCIRGMLCSNCNTALGFLKEDRGRIEGLLRYMDATGIK